MKQEKLIGIVLIVTALAGAFGFLGVLAGINALILTAVVTLGVLSLILPLSFGIYLLLK